MTESIQRMLTADVYAVVGASRDPRKYGFLVYQSLKAAGKKVYAVNPQAQTVDADPCYPSLEALPQTPQVVVMVVPPGVTEAAVTECARGGITQIWMQPGAESAAAVSACRNSGIDVVWGGPCIMVGLKTLRFAP